MNREWVFRGLILVLLLTIVSLQVLALQYKQREVHTLVLNWPLSHVAPYGNVSGYVTNYTWRIDALITAVQVWMGNPSGVFWEGDVYVAMDNIGDFTSPDQVIVHYQFDKHAESPVPHQLWFEIGLANSGFRIRAGQTLWVWRAFNNISGSATTAGDGQVIIYYVAL